MKSGLRLSLKIVLQLATCISFASCGPKDDPDPCAVFSEGLRFGLTDGAQTTCDEQLGQIEVEPVAETVTTEPVVMAWSDGNGNHQTTINRYDHTSDDENGESQTIYRPGNFRDGNCAVTSMFFASTVNGLISFEDEFPTIDFLSKVSAHLNANGYDGGLRYDRGDVGSITARNTDYWSYLDTIGIDVTNVELNEVAPNQAFVALVHVSTVNGSYGFDKRNGEPNHAVTFVKQDDGRYKLYDPNRPNAVLVNQAFVDRYVEPDAVLVPGAK